MDSKLNRYLSWKLLFGIGVVFVILSPATLVIDIMTTEYTNDYVYNASETVSACELSLSDGMSANQSVQYELAYFHNYSDLSDTGKIHFKNALQNGKYTIPNESNTASDFTFPDDQSGPGNGCYIIEYNRTDYQLHTYVNQIRKDNALEPKIVGPVFLIAGILLILLSFISGNE